jgi:hypothetical protein
MNSCTSTLSNCGNYSISRICLPDIYQGDSAILELTLLDRLGIPVDLNTLNSIIILLYGIDESYKLIYEWPDITSTNNITILQKDNIDIGKISVIIPNDYTKNLVSGTLCGSIRMNLNSIITGEFNYSVTFPSVQFANIKYTEINFI